MDQLKPVTAPPKPDQNKFLKWGVNIVIILVVALAGLMIYQTVLLPKNNPKPTPTPSVPAWQEKSEKNVNAFLNSWLKSVGATNSDQYATQAKEYLTISAQAKLPTLSNANGTLATKLSDQLTLLIGGNVPKSFSVTNISQIDEKTTEVTALLTDSAQKNTNKIFTVKQVSGNWLIDSVKNWGSN